MINGVSGHGLDVSRETSDRLRALQAMLIKWNPAINLVSKSSLVDAWDRHFLDSAQLFDLAPTGFRVWADLGSGGGFPGLVIACLAKEKNPEARIVLVESDLRKAAYLSQAVRSLGLNAEVLAERIESISPLNADVLSARALAPLDVLCGYALRHMAASGLAIFPKGANHPVEIQQARRRFEFEITVRPSETDPSAAILLLSQLKSKIS